MALARIITRSQACSRELALDLLARGYTVEIVSPDAIPDNLADLELRVDTNDGDQLVANVTAYDGGRSTSLEFLHHLKAPMGDFIRRVPEIPEVPTVSIPLLSYVGPVARGNGSDVVIPTVEGNLFEERADSRAPEPADEGPVESVYASHEEIVEPHSYEAENLSPVAARSSMEQESLDAPILAPSAVPHPVEVVPVSSPANEIPGYFEQVEASPVVAFVAEALRRTARRVPVSKFRFAAASWRWRVALTFATVVVLALLLGFGLRRTGKAAAQSSSEEVADKLAIASNPGTLLNARVPEKDAANGVVVAAAPDPKVVKDPGQSANRTIAARAETRSAKTLHPAQKRASRSHDGDVVARDTVVYLDDRYKPVPKTQSAKNATRRHPTARKHSSEVIAANKVTYLDKPAPKPAK
jgi:hypothetical protein